MRNGLPLAPPAPRENRRFEAALFLHVPSLEVRAVLARVDPQPDDDGSRGLVNPPRRYRRRPEWMDDARGQPRWCDVRTVLARVGADEFLGKTRDLSLGGMGLRLNGFRPTVGQELLLDVVFDAEVRSFRGRVAYSIPRPWGSEVGIRCDEPPPQMRAFLSRRYELSEDGLGSVK